MTSLALGYNMVIIKMGEFLQNMYFHRKGRREVNKNVIKDENIDTITFLNCLKQNIPWSRCSTWKRKNCYVALKKYESFGTERNYNIIFPGVLKMKWNNQVS